MLDPKNTTTEEGSGSVVWHSLSENLMDLDERSSAASARQADNAPKKERPEPPVREKRSEPPTVNITAHQPDRDVYVWPDNGYAQEDQEKRTGKKRRNYGAVAVALVALAMICTASVVLVNAHRRAQEREARIQSVEAAIDALGTISPDSLPAIEAAEAMLDALVQEERDSVSNQAALAEARAEYQRLAQMLYDADEALHAIKRPITVDDKSAIERARAAYDALEEAGLSGYRTDNARTLSEYEEEWTQAYANSLLDTGAALCAQGRYQDALDKYYEVLDNYRFVYSDALEGAAATLESWLGACYEAKDYETMYVQLQEVHRRGFATSFDSLVSLEEKLNKKLESLRPRNGKVLKKNIDWGYCAFEVTAGNQDVCFKLESRDDPDTYAIVFVRKNEKASVKVHDGDYIMKYTLGDVWYGSDDMFGQDALYGKVNEIVSFETTYSGSRVYYSTASISLAKHHIGETGIPAITRAEW